MGFQSTGKAIIAVASAVFAGLTPHVANAQGDACVSQLTPDGKTVYAAARAANPTLPTLRETMTTVARSLVAAGKIAPAGAPDNGAAAGKCMAAHLQTKTSPTLSNANVPALAIGSWRDTIRGPNSYWFSGYRLDQMLIVQPTGSCRFGGLPDRVGDAQCTYAGDQVTIVHAQTRAVLRFKDGQLDGLFEGRDASADLTMSKQ